MKLRSLLGVVIVAWLAFPLTDPQKAQADEFYKGKTIRFVVGFAAGGGFDLAARVVGRHIHSRWQDPEVKDLPLIPEIIKGEDNLAAYRTWVGSYEFQRPLTVPPGTPKDRLQILRKAFADTMKDPDFIAEAEKSKLEVTHVSGKRSKNMWTRSCRSLPGPKSCSTS